MTLYSLYGLCFASEVPLPEALPAASGAAVDVRIRIAPVPEAGIPGGVAVEEGSMATAHEFWLSVPGVARYLVRGGSEMLVDPHPECDDASLRLYLLGSCLGALLTQRGRLVLHGNAVQVGNACLVCLGDSGAGKSTLAAAFAQQGYPVLADDVIAVDEVGRAIPGIPRVKLWQDAADRLGIPTHGLRRICPDMEKYDWPLAERFCREALPIRWIFLLSTGEQTGSAATAVEGFERFRILRDNSYRFHFLSAMSRLPHHLTQCAALSGGAEFLRLPRALDAQPAETVRLIIDRIAPDTRELDG